MPPTDRPYAGRSSKDRRDERRERFLTAGLELIGESGLALLTVRGVCTRAGLTPRYFYEEFGTIDELTRQLFDREFDRSMACVVEAVGGAGDHTGERVVAAVGAVLDVMGEVPSRAALLLTETSGSGAVAVRSRERMEDVVALLAALGTSAYGPDGATAPATAAAESAVRVAAAFVAGGFAQTIDAWLRGQVDVSREDLTRQLAAQIVAVGDAAFEQLGETPEGSARRRAPSARPI